MDKKSVLEKVFALLPKDSIRFIVHYGKTDGRDIDLFVVLKAISGYGCIKLDLLDITLIDDCLLNKMIIHFDPILTEPILTGNRIYGQEIKSLRQRLKLLEANENTVKYFKNRAVNFYYWAKGHYLNKDFNKLIRTLSFVVSYIYFAKYYRDHSSVITLTELLKIFPDTLLPEILLATKGKKEIKLAEMDSFFQNAEMLLTQFKL